MTKRSSLFRLAFPLVLLCSCRQPGNTAEGNAGAAPPPAAAAVAAVAENCSMRVWASTLELGLRSDAESARQLAALKSDAGCALEIRKLAEVLLDDRVVEHEQHPERAAKVRFKNPDLQSLRLRGQQTGAMVILEAIIDANGRVTRVELLKPHPDQRINNLFIETARGWLFRPAREGAAYRESKQTFTANIHVR